MRSTPIYTMTIPSSKKEIRYRPFLIREEKSLLMAQFSQEPGVMYETIKDVITACVKDPIDVDKLASFDVEYMFLQLRAVSVSEVTDLLFGCDECGPDNERARTRIRINIKDAQVVTPEGHTNKIPLFDDVGVVMKYPSLKVMQALETVDDIDVDAMMKIISQCIEYVYDKEQIYRLGTDANESELSEFLNSLSSEQFDKMRDFFTTMPSLRMNVNYKCPVCSHEHKKYIQGIASFF